METGRGEILRSLCAPWHLSHPVVHSCRALYLFAPNLSARLAWKVRCEGEEVGATSPTSHSRSIRTSRTTWMGWHGVCGCVVESGCAPPPPDGLAWCDWCVCASLRCGTTHLGPWPGRPGVIGVWFRNAVLPVSPIRCFFVKNDKQQACSPSRAHHTNVGSAPQGRGARRHQCYVQRRWIWPQLLTSAVIK